MKILYLITGLGGGGAEKVVVELADRMHDLGHSVKIAYLKGEIIVKPKNRNIELIYLGLENFKNINKSCESYKELISDFCPDVVHSHMIHANIFARLNRTKNIKKLICTAHSSNEGGYLRMLAYRFTNKLSDLNTNVSYEATKLYIDKHAFSSTAITMYNGIDLQKYKKETVIDDNLIKKMDLCDKDFLLLSVGRLNEAKDYPNLLNSFKKLIDETGMSIYLVIVGEGEQRRSIEQLIEKLNLSSYVSLLGRRDDIPHLMSLADVFILSSSYEGFGLVVAEAMACQTLVVATDSGGVKEVLGGNGFLVPPKDSNALSIAILEALSLSEQDKSKLVSNALIHVQNNFDLEVIIQKWLELYER